MRPSPSVSLKQQIFLWTSYRLFSVSGKLHPLQRVAGVSSGDSLDWKDLSAPEITQRVVSQVQPGSICLFHNAALHTPEALPGIIEALIQDGYTIVPVSELLLTEDYVMDHTGRQCPA